MAQPCFSTLYSSIPTKSNQGYHNIISLLIQNVSSSKKRNQLRTMQKDEIASQTKPSKFKTLSIKPVQLNYRRSTRKIVRPNTAAGNREPNSIELFIPSTFKYEQSIGSPANNRNEMLSIRKDRFRNRLVNSSFNQNCSIQLIVK